MKEALALFYKGIGMNGSLANRSFLCWPTTAFLTIIPEHA
jgi:hypothetical protein